jgi:hypothetical protein
MSISFGSSETTDGAPGRRRAGSCQRGRRIGVQIWAKPARLPAPHNNTPTLAPAEHASPAVGHSLSLQAWTVFVLGSDGWVSPAGPAPKARNTFSVTALTIGLNGAPGPGGVSLVSHQIDPDANTPAPLGAV